MGTNTLSPKNKKRVRADGRHINRYVAQRKMADNSQLPEKGKKLPPLKRGSYFKTYRSQRTALNILENTFTEVYNRSSYRSNRYMYYFVIPHLARYLWFGPDRDRLQDVEHDLYNQMLSHKFVKKINQEPVRVPIWLTRLPRLRTVAPAKL